MDAKLKPDACAGGRQREHRRFDQAPEHQERFRRSAGRHRQRRRRDHLHRRDHRGFRRARLRLRADPVQPAQLRAGPAGHRGHRRHAGADLRHPDDARPQASLAAGFHHAPIVSVSKFKHLIDIAEPKLQKLESCCKPRLTAAFRRPRRPDGRPVRRPCRRSRCLIPFPGHQLPAFHRPGHRLHRGDGGGRLPADRRLSDRACGPCLYGDGARGLLSPDPGRHHTCWAGIIVLRKSVSGLCVGPSPSYKPAIVNSHGLTGSLGRGALSAVSLEAPMAGHSQFKNIMHRKGRVDAVRSKVFSKLAREITVAAKMGMPDPTMNPRLRAAILAARAENMPKDNIQRAINKAVGRRGRQLRRDPLRGLRPRRRRADRRGDDRQPQPHRLRYPLLLHQERRQPRRDRRGLLHVRPGGLRGVRAPRSRDADTMLEAAIEAGADDVVLQRGRPRDLLRPVAAQRGHQGARRRNSASRRPPSWSGSRRTPSRSTTRPARSSCALMETLEEHDDVQNVYGNFEVSDALMQKMAWVRPWSRPSTAPRPPSSPLTVEPRSTNGARHARSASSASIPACAIRAGASSRSRARSSPIVACGVVTSDADLDLALRLKQLHDRLTEVVRRPGRPTRSRWRKPSSTRTRRRP